MVKRETTTTKKVPVARRIDGTTQIVFTFKTFLATIGTILGIFYGFYQLVIVPKVNSTEENYKEMFSDQKKQNTIFYQELGKINTSIGALGASVNALNNNRSYIQSEQNIPNTGGSFGDNTTGSRTLNGSNSASVSGNH